MAPHSKIGDAGDVHVHDRVEMKALPSFSELHTKVMRVVSESSWWDLYGVDWLHMIIAIAVVPVALTCLASDALLLQTAGIFLMGCYHGTIANKCGHLAAHGAMFKQKTLNDICAHLSISFVGCFSTKLATGIHVKIHHPHTNIIGLGDSSTWKAPMVPRYLYLFLLPLTLPVLTPLVSLQQLIQSRDWRDLATFTTLGASGLLFHCWLLVRFSGYTVVGSLVGVAIYRAMLGVPYIHVNIFQHIGLPMYSPDDRPTRIYQMSTGCLNISQNVILDATFGHSIIGCHVEHHLFPKLSDNMCLKVKPIVQQFLKANNMSYNQDTYLGRLRVFMRDYKRLMVNAPPITHFVGIQ